MGVGDEIRRRREERGWSQRTLAIEAGVRTAYIAQLEEGFHVRARPRLLAAVAEALGTTPPDLAGEG